MVHRMVYLKFPSWLRGQRDCRPDAASERRSEADWCEVVPRSCTTRVFGQAPIGRLICLLIVGLTIILLGEFAAAQAAYKPAPPHVVAAAHQKNPPPRVSVAKRAWVVCKVFGRRHCRAALNVFWCESSLRPWAKNGQYLGIAQMGSGERARWGHDRRNVWVQARAARRYFRFDGGWGPWSCKPTLW